MLVSAARHKQILTAIFAIIALYAGAIIMAKHDDILAVQKSFFDGAPGYAYASWVAFVLVPASCIFIAIAIHKALHWNLCVLPAIPTVFILGLYGAVPIAYLVWWHVKDPLRTAP